MFAPERVNRQKAHPRSLIVTHVGHNHPQADHGALKRKESWALPHVSIVTCRSLAPASSWSARGLPTRQSTLTAMTTRINKKRKEGNKAPRQSTGTRAPVSARDTWGNWRTLRRACACSVHADGGAESLVRACLMPDGNCTTLHQLGWLVGPFLRDRAVLQPSAPHFTNMATLCVWPSSKRLLLGDVDGPLLVWRFIHRRPK